jgi:hypothetical protein
MQIVLQAILLLAFAGGMATQVVRLGSSGSAPSHSVDLAPRAVPLTVARVDGRAWSTVALSAVAARSSLAPGQPLLPPVELTSASGRVEVARGTDRWQLEQGTIAWSLDGVVSLVRGRLRVSSEQPLRVRVPRFDVELEGRRFALWADDEGLWVAALASVARSNAEALPAGHGWTREEGREVIGPLADAFVVARPPPGRPPGVRRVRMNPTEPIRWMDPLGRQAEPGGSSPSLAAVKASFPDPPPRPAVVAAPIDDGPAATARDASRPADGRPRPPRRRPDAPDVVRPDGPSVEPTEPRRSEDPPSRLQVDWTAIGRPKGRVLEGTKKETPAPGTR